jgi:hypothetical protein
MGVDLNFMNQVLADFQKNKPSGATPASTTLRHKWRPGPNNIRLMPFKHIFTEWDVLRGICTREQIGDEVELVCLPMIRWFIGGKGGEMKVGLGKSDSICPMWKAWWSRSYPDRQKNWQEGPQEVYIANMIDTDEPERGIGYGIWDVINGHTNKVTPSDPGVEPLGSTIIKDLVGYGDRVLGPNGMDIVMHKVLKVLDKNKEPTLQLDHTRAEGALEVRVSGNVVVPSTLASEVKDLLSRSDCYPGFSSKGIFLTNEAKAFTDFCEGKTVITPATAHQDSPLLEEESVNAEEQIVEIDTGDGYVRVEEAPTPVEAEFTPPATAEGTETPQPQFTPTRRRKPQTDDWVTATDPQDNRTYVGKMLKQDGNELDIQVHPDWQVGEQETKDVEEMIRGGRDVARFKAEHVKIKKE